VPAAKCFLTASTFPNEAATIMESSTPLLPPCLRRNQFDIDDTGTVWDSSEAMVSPNFNPYSLNNATHTTFCSCYRFHFNLVEKPG
ncbi:uncharacterized protein METZ01_LOCUS283131, partial [marine metagenome]